MFRLALLLAALFLAVPVPGRALNIVINNQNANYTASQVYFTFRDAPVTGTINGQALFRDTCYTLDDIGSGITLQSFSGGRIYFSLGSPIAGTGDPEPINSSVATWGTRFDKMELTYGQSNHYGVANLTAIDYFAIPLAIKTYTGTTATGTPKAMLTYQQPGNTVAANLGALTGNNARVVLYDKLGNFLRVLGPTLSPSGVYPSMQPYLSAVQTAGQATQIVGLYSRAGTTDATRTQNYDFTATFDGSGNIQLLGGGTPNTKTGASVGPGHTILILAKDLALGIYSANPPYTVDGASANIGNNDVYSAVVRDILTGYALGFVNSTTADPNTGVAFKDETSDKWWSSPHAFGFLQGNPSYYDRYAAYLQSISDAYGHPFSDRWETVQVSIDPSSVGTMELDVLPDVAPVSAPVIGSVASATAQNGVAFSYQIAASNSPTGFTATGLPVGLGVDPASGLISGTPTVSGIFSVGLAATNAGGTGNLTLALTVDDRFDAWKSANFTPAEQADSAVSGPLGDATGAGVANVVKYALGIPPKRSGTTGLPTLAVQNLGGTNYLCLTYTQDPLAGDVSLAVQVSNDLRGWNSGTVYTTEVSRTSNSDGTQTVVTRGNTPVGNGSQFMRLSVSLSGS